MHEVDTMNDCTCEQGELGGQVLPMCQSNSAYSTSQDLSPLTERVDPDTLTGPARKIAQALLRDTADIDPSWMHDPLA